MVIALYLIGFAITGVPWWALTGLLCGLLQLIPHFGSLIVLGVALLLKGLAGGDWWLGPLGVILAVPVVAVILVVVKAARQKPVRARYN